MLWLQLERSRVPDGSATAKALNYSLNAWAALTHHLVDGNVPVDNNHCENLIRPWAMGAKHGCSRTANWPASVRRW
jgi:transposase